MLEQQTDPAFFDLISLQTDSSLYIHIPFCSRRCDYCSFYTISLHDAQKARSTEIQHELDLPSLNHHDLLIGSYLPLLKNDVELVINRYTKPFVSVYIGGGNPGLLSNEQIRDLAELVCYHGPPQEMTIEMNPEHITESRLATLVQSGFTRLSIGVQSLQPETLKTLGRNTTVHQTEAALSLLEGVRSHLQISLDVICCVPGQSIENAKGDIDLIIDRYRPEHVSLYNLTVEPDTVLAERVARHELTEMDDDAQSIMLDTLWKHLRSRGFYQYEVSNFYYEDPMRRSLHNQTYWRMHLYIGIGSSAVSTLYDPIFKRYRRYEGLPLTGKCHDESEFRLIHQEHGLAYGEERLSSLDYVKELFIMGLRTNDGVDIRSVNQSIDISLTEILETCIRNNDLHAYLMLDDTSFRVTYEGIMILDTLLRNVISALDTVEMMIGQDFVITRDT